jgi:Raf kinase inhibitor-like YbhB/YbcL family protein
MRRWYLVRAAVVVLVAAGCSHDGRALSAPTRPAPSTTVATQAATAGPLIGSAAGAIMLASTAFLAGSDIPVRYTCDGASISPPLLWTGVASDAGELAISVVDPDAGGFVHWLVTGLPPQLQSLAEGMLPEGVVEAPNSRGTPGWTGPCPPKGTTHHYVFTLYALPAGCRSTDLARVEACATATGTFTARYQRA